MQVIAETTIAAPQAVVFALVIDIPRWPETIAGVESVEMLTSGPIAPGTRFRETRVMFGHQATEEMTVAELRSPTRFVLTAENHGTRYRAEHLITPDGPRGTHVKLVFEGQPVTLTARLMSPLALLMRGTIRKQLAADLNDIKRSAEEKAGAS
jgi:carbon monoxide dehydrogenase subunit G